MPGSPGLTVGWVPTPHAHVWTNWRKDRELERILLGATCHGNPKPIEKVLTGATVEIRWYRGVIVNGTKVKAWVKSRMFEETLCDMVMSPLSKCIIWMDIMSDWRILLVNIIKQKAYKFVLQVVLTGQVEWEFIVYPVQVINLKQC